MAFTQAPAMNLMPGAGYGPMAGYAMQPMQNGSSGFLGGFGLNAGCGCNQMGGLGQQNQQMSALMNQMMMMMSMLMQMMMMNSMQTMMSSGSPDFGGMGNVASGNSAAGIGDFLGGSAGSGNSAGDVGSAGSTSSDSGVSAANGSGEKAAQIAKQYLGRKSGEINDMANFTHAGGMDNNCADFVSACLANAGTYKKKPGDASVRVLKQHLQEDGWKKVSKQQAKPGDVAIFNGTQHVELVVENGAKQLIGSNNRGGGNVQYVGTDSGNWGSVEYFSKG